MSIKAKPRGKPFQKGDPRAGRPKGSLNKVTQEVRDWARSILEDPKVQAMTLQKAQDGSLPPGIFNELLHYAYGKPKETVAVTDPYGLPLALARIERVVLDGRRDAED